MTPATLSLGLALTILLIHRLAMYYTHHTVDIQKGAKLKVEKRPFFYSLPLTHHTQSRRLLLQSFSRRLQLP
jgi:hypothetical protein